MNEVWTKALAQALLLSTLTFAVGENLPDPIALFRKALKPSVAYTCKIVVSHWRSLKGDTAVLREWRLTDGRYRIEYLAPQNLRGTVLVSDGKKRWRIVKGKAFWEFDVEGLTPERLGLLSKNYRLTFLKETTLLGRKVWQIAVEPKIEGKLHHKFWLDAENGIALKAEVADEKGSPIAFMSVTELKFLNPKEIPNDFFSVPAKGAVAKSPAQLTKTQAQRIWEIRLPENLPFGFALERIEEIMLPKDFPALHAVYTDGLTKISLFVLPKDIRLPLKASRVSVVKKPLGKQVLLVVGSIDKNLLDKIADKF